MTHRLRKMLATALLGAALGELHHGQAAGQADRDQSQCRYPPGSARSPSAGRRADHPGKPGRLPERRPEARMKLSSSAPDGGCAVAAPAAGAGADATGRAARAARQVGERFDGYLGSRAAVGGAPPTGRRDQHPSAFAVHQSRLAARRDRTSRRHRRRLRTAAPRRAGRGLYAERRRVAAARAGRERYRCRSIAPAEFSIRRGLTRLTMRAPLHKGAAPWRARSPAMFLALCSPHSWAGRRTGEDHGDGRDRAGPKASTRRAARFARRADRTGAADGSRADPQGRARPDYRIGAAVQPPCRRAGRRRAARVGPRHPVRDLARVLAAAAVPRVRRRRQERHRISKTPPGARRARSL